MKEVDTIKFFDEYTLALEPTENWKEYYIILTLPANTQLVMTFDYNTPGSSYNIDTTLEIKNCFGYEISELSEELNDFTNYILNKQFNDSTYEEDVIIYQKDRRPDTSLSIPGKAADAAAVGAAVDNAKAAIIKPPNFSKWEWAQAFSTAFNQDITFSKSGWWCLHLQKKDGTNAAIRAEISIYIESAERYREILAYQSTKTTENLEYMSQWYYFYKGQTINFSGSAAVCNLYYCPCL